MPVEVYQWIIIVCQGCGMQRKTKVHECTVHPDGTEQYGVEDLSPCVHCGAETWSITP